MRDEYKIQRSGKTYVLYAGLLAEVHAKFSAFTIDTELLETGDQPIVKAVFSGYAEPEEEPSVRTSGIGTAGRGTDRKGPAVDAPIEMAETRAKARALRDAVNVGETAFEEIPEEDSSKAHVVGTAANRAGDPIPPAAQAQRKNQPRKTKDSEGPIKPATLARLNFLAGVYAEAVGQTKEEHLANFAKELGRVLEGISEGEGQTWIGRYERGLDKLEKLEHSEASDVGNYEERS